MTPSFQLWVVRTPLDFIAVYRREPRWQHDQWTSFGRIHVFGTWYWKLNLLGMLGQLERNQPRILVPTQPTHPSIWDFHCTPTGELELKVGAFEVERFCHKTAEAFGLTPDSPDLRLQFIE